MVKERKGFMKWYHSPSGKKVTGIVYSLGASVVIVGALFKILHWPFASELLMVGMLTEAVLFAIGILDDPHADLHWDHVFPQLTSKDADPLMDHITTGGSGSSLPNTGTISENDAQKLAESIQNMSQTAAQLSNISKVAGLTDSYVENLTNASNAAASFAEKQTTLDKASEELLSSYQGISSNLNVAATGAQSIAEKANEISKNLGSINTAYELQLKGLNAQTESLDAQNKKITAVTSEFEKLQDLASQSAQNMNSYKQMSEQLAKNISDLNGVYGNMLNALKA